MPNKILHITNGTHLTTKLNALNIEGEILTWHEMLCEGPTTFKIDCDEFINVRQQFLNEYYDIDIDSKAFYDELKVLN